jgi:hypothetical protein
MLFDLTLDIQLSIISSIDSVFGMEEFGNPGNSHISYGHKIEKYLHQPLDFCVPRIYDSLLKIIRL